MEFRIPRNSVDVSSAPKVLYTCNPATSSMSIHNFIPAFIHSFIHSPVHAFVHLFIHSFIHSLVDLSPCLSVESAVQSPELAVSILTTACGVSEHNMDLYQGLAHIMDNTNSANEQRQSHLMHSVYRVAVCTSGVGNSTGDCYDS